MLRIFVREYLNDVIQNDMKNIQTYHMCNARSMNKQTRLIFGPGRLIRYARTLQELIIINP